MAGEGSLLGSCFFSCSGRGASRVSGCFGFRLVTAGALVLVFFSGGGSASTPGSGKGVGATC
jgi:hypothetical protein